MAIREIIERDLGQAVERDFSDRVVAGMATMPSRAATFELALASIVRQVDHLYLYLDGHTEVPRCAAKDPRITPILSADVPGLHANGKLLGLGREPGDCIYVCVDDDIFFPSHFVSNMRKALARHDDRAVVGLHGNRLARPLVRYFQDRRTVAHYIGVLAHDRTVDTLGTGAVMFRKGRPAIDLAAWPQVSMADLGVAIAAAGQGIASVCVARKEPWVICLAQDQPDSLHLARRKDDSFQTELGRRLIELKQSRAVSG